MVACSPVPSTSGTSNSRTVCPNVSKSQSDESLMMSILNVFVPIFSARFVAFLELSLTALALLFVLLLEDLSSVSKLRTLSSLLLSLLCFLSTQL
jgi:hypothetical protein